MTAAMTAPLVVPMSAHDTTGLDAAFWRGRRVFVTGHTGFKGAWLCLWLQRLGAEVCGYALQPPTEPSLYAQAEAGAGLQSITADVRDGERLAQALHAFAPDVVLHLAAQSVVLSAYTDPAGTYATNVMGTVNLFEALRRHVFEHRSDHCARTSARRVALLNVTTDKVYRNQRWHRGYRESDRLGGHDPYAASKACSELITESYVSAFFSPTELDRHGVAVASARAGNVVGGGDWTPHQLVPAVLAAAQAGQPVALRQPASTRPWQHVLDCLQGYLTLARTLYTEPDRIQSGGKDGDGKDGGWNFGPPAHEQFSVAEVAQMLAAHWQVQPPWVQAEGATPHEAHELRLDCSKAQRLLHWQCRLSTPTALQWVADWHLQQQAGRPAREICLAQIKAFEALETSAVLQGASS